MLSGIRAWEYAGVLNPDWRLTTVRPFERKESNVNEALSMKHSVSQAVLLMLLTAFILAGCNGGPPSEPDPRTYTIELINFPQDEKEYLETDLNKFCFDSLRNGKQEKNSSEYEFTLCGGVTSNDLKLRLEEVLDLQASFDHDRMTFTAENWYKASPGCDGRMCYADAKAESDHKEDAFKKAKDEGVIDLWALASVGWQVTTKFASPSCSGPSGCIYEIILTHHGEDMFGDSPYVTRTGRCAEGELKGIPSGEKYEKGIDRSGFIRMLEQAEVEKKRFAPLGKDGGTFRAYVRMKRSLPAGGLVGLWLEAFNATSIPPRCE